MTLPRFSIKTIGFGRCALFVEKLRAKIKEANRELPQKRIMEKYYEF